MQQEAMSEDLQSVRTENLNMKAEMTNISLKFKMNEFSGNDEKVKYYIGLPRFTDLSLFNFLEPHMSKKPSLDKFQLLILTLMSLRLNVSMQLLVYEFNISPSSVSRFFFETIDVIYVYSHETTCILARQGRT